MKVAVVIPALNEEENIGQVLAEIPCHLVSQIVVADNGSTDATAEIARAHGAEVVTAPVRGYGFACLAALERVSSEVDTLVFLDADGSDCPQEMAGLLRPIKEGRADLVIGSRVLGQREPGAMPWHALWGNLLATFLIRLLYRVQVTDLGPFRAIRRDVLERIQMERAGYRWTTEMIVKAALLGYRIEERPANYRRRGGQSKISGTALGSLRAAHGIIGTIFRYRLKSYHRYDEEGSP